jgi:hypothetical protein
MVFDPGFVPVVLGHFHPSFTFKSFAAFYFIDELGSVLLNKQAFFMFRILRHYKSTPVTILTFPSFRVISCFIYFFISQFSLRKLPLPLPSTFVTNAEVDNRGDDLFCRMTLVNRSMFIEDISIGHDFDKLTQRNGD